MPDIGEALNEELKYTSVFSYTIGYDVAVGNKMEHHGTLSSRVPSTLVTQNEDFHELLDSFREEWASWIIQEAEKRIVPAHCVYIYGNMIRYTPDGKHYERNFRVWALGVAEIKEAYLIRYGEDHYNDVIDFRNLQKSKGYFI